MTDTPPSASAVLDVEALTSALLDRDDLDADLAEEEEAEAEGRGFRVAESAEEQLELMGRTFQRDEFAALSLIGQFNLAFLVARLGRRSLFIIDQHAADEKANYEHFCATLRLHTQQLLAPVPLELSPADLALARSELPALSACGFALQDDGARLLLTGFPLSGHTELGVADFHELLAALAERRTPAAAAAAAPPLSSSAPSSSSQSASQANVPRPRRVTAMLMSRACRRAVMIGDPLEPDQCRKIIRTLATLQHPWQCPHGRPTINFLGDLSAVPKCTYTRRVPAKSPPRSQPGPHH